MIIRRHGRGWVALCAAKHPMTDEDIYLDDSQDRAIRKKLLADFHSEGLITDADFAALTKTKRSQVPEPKGD